ncbi:MAG: MucR family transcriptional regulator [Rhodospirillaceae bacterium]|jgi:predicted transcriptional regulator|nr:MucR family transcriptional regulator [Rhodospirillaceae bacterium]MBT7770112.1 MucR family transcriptional regulator [Rhodospirillales bacterium]MBT4700002.1 MucR family transcriptional regulator [Rhodospirillaceae bacterium]MBT5035329.1 MucR family transcriptional regulator [Rhodospirillaceae bacterium]MBT6221863.1 MucR family transcriptional regulator [Rhodospirillaceae bacterium]
MGLKPEKSAEIDPGDVLRLSTEIVSSYVSKNQVAREDLKDLILNVVQALTSVAGGSTVDVRSTQPPPVSIRKSVTPDYIICLEDGKKLKMLKRHLRTYFNLTPEAYRAKWGLSPDYPMVAPNYAKKRSQFAKNSKLGKK